METKITFTLILISSILLLADARGNPKKIHTVKHDVDTQITEFCKKTTNPVLCAQTIKPHFLKNSIDPIRALDIEVDATNEGAKKTLVDIQILESKPGVTKSIKGSFDICKDQYNNMLDAIKEAKEAIAKKDIITAKFKFSAVISYEEACKDAFEGGQIPFNEDSDNVFNLGGNSLDIIADIEEAQGPPKLPLPVRQTPSQYSNIIGTIS